MKLFNFKKSKNINLKEKIDLQADPFIDIGIIIKESRIKKNLSIEDLSSLSKIPISTIIGIEDNIKEFIPQFPFSRSILIKLEECLFLERFKLIKLLQKEDIPVRKAIKRNFILNKFDIFNSLQGSFIYLLIIILSIFVLNIYYLNTRIIEFKFIEKKIN